jgi:hypothetical protein
MATTKKSKIPPAKLELYERLIATNSNIERKGAIHPYTALNGHMFTYLDQTGTMAIRLPEDAVDAFINKYKTSLFKSYGVVKKEYVTVPDTLLSNTKELKKYLAMSYTYVKNAETQVNRLADDGGAI